MTRARRFEGRTAVVTGAGSGMGREIALEFAREGANVVLSDIVPARVAEVVQEVAALGVKAVSAPGDVTSSAYAESLAAMAIENLGRADILVNNAGIVDGYKAVHEVTEHLWKRILEVNLTGPFLVTRAFLPRMIAARSGVIVNIASVAAQMPQIAGAAYSASKSGLVSLTASIASTYCEDGIRCVAVCPGGISTNLSVSIERSTDEKVLRAMARHGPRRGHGKPKQIADVVLFLASDEASFINGSAIVADNALMVW